MSCDDDNPSKGSTRSDESKSIHFYERKKCLTNRTAADKSLKAIAYRCVFGFSLASKVVYNKGNLAVPGVP